MRSFGSAVSRIVGLMVLMARVCRQIRVQLEEAGPMLKDVDLQIAAMALYYMLEW